MQQISVSSDLLQKLLEYHHNFFFKLVDCPPKYVSKQNYLQRFSFVTLILKAKGLYSTK